MASVVDAVGASGDATALASAAGDASKSTSEQISDQFLTLLVAQMKNQTPTDPMDNSEFTSQLAQINTVSGINDLNETLSAITGQINATQQLQAASLVGRDVMVPGDAVYVGDEGNTTPFGIDLKQGAQEVVFTISRNGEVISEQTVNNVSKGMETFLWDGTNEKGESVAPGKYTITASAKDINGDKVDFDLLALGRVHGVITGDGAPELDLGPAGTVTLDEVRQFPSPYDYAAGKEDLPEDEESQGNEA